MPQTESVSLEDWANSKPIRVIIDPTPLRPEYEPDELKFREKQLKEVVFGVRNFAEHKEWRGDGPHLWVIGPSGSGKTLTVKKALVYLAKRADHLHVSLRVCYLNCANKGRYAILKELLNEFGAPTKFGSPEYALMEKYKGIKGNRLVVLDEVDSYLKGGDDSLLYTLSRTAGLGVILVSSYLRLEELIKNEGTLSSLRGGHIRFKPYDAAEIRGILDERAEKAFSPKPSLSVLNLIAAIVAGRSGDARYAIKLLAKVAEMAEERGIKRLDDDMVKLADEELHEQELIDDIRSLPLQAQIMFAAIVDGHPEQEWLKVQQKYHNIAGDDAIGDRRCYDLLRRLDKTGLIFFLPRQHKGSLVKLQVEPELARRVVEQLKLL